MLRYVIREKNAYRLLDGWSSATVSTGGVSLFSIHFRVHTWGCVNIFCSDSSIVETLRHTTLRSFSQAEYDGKTYKEKPIPESLMYATLVKDGVTRNGCYVHVSKL